MWNASTGACVFNNTSKDISESDEKEETGDSKQQEHSIVNASYHRELNVIVTVTFDHNITFHTVDTLEPQKHVSCYGH